MSLEDILLCSRLVISYNVQLKTPLISMSLEDILLCSS
jgi:hypothetical protein